MSRLGSKKKMFLMNSGSAPISESLLFTINTNLDTGSDFTIPTDSGETYNYNVNWGDGNSSYSQTGNATHTYSVDGIYQIEITGTFPKFYFANTGDKLKITSVDRWGTLDYSTDFGYSFFGCSNLSSVGSDAYCFNQIISGSRCFQSSGITGFSDVVTFENLIYAQIMFYGCSNLTYFSNYVTFQNLGNGQQMFQNSGLLDLPPLVTFSNVFNFSTGLFGRTLPTIRYSQLLIDMEDLNPNDNVTFRGGNSKYNSSAVTARANLIARGWTITDGGLE